MQLLSVTDTVGRLDILVAFIQKIKLLIIVISMLVFIMLHRINGSKLIINFL